MTPRLTDLTSDRVRRGLGRRGRNVARRAEGAFRSPVRRAARTRVTAVRNRQFVRRVAGRTQPPDYWSSFADQLSEAWYDGGRRSLPARFGARSWRSLPGVDGTQALDTGFRSLQDGDFEWAELIADAFITAHPRHRRGHKLKALVHAAREEWRPAQEHWRTALGGKKYRGAARRWVINERGRATARKVIAMMPDAAVLTAADGTSLRDLLDIRPDRSREFNERLGAVLIQNVTHTETARLRPLLEAWSATQQREPEVLAPGEVARTVQLMGADEFRTFVAGRSVALVANSPSLLGSGLGEVIDGYDLVIRFNSFALQPEDTGSRTDVHVAFHKYDFNLDVAVDVRILLSAREELWRQSMKARIRPDAQNWLGDSSLRWPAVSRGLIGPDEPFKMPTAGFNMLRLLLDLDVCSAIDLIGFDFYASGMHRLADAATIPHAPGHDSAAEQQWVLAHAASRSGKIISMLPAAADRSRPEIGSEPEPAAAESEVAEPTLIERAEAQVADADFAAALQSLQEAAVVDAPLSDRFTAHRYVFLLSKVLSALSRYHAARDVLRLVHHSSTSASRAASSEAEIAWIQHDYTGGAELATYALRAHLGNRRAQRVRDRCQHPITPPADRAPDGGIAHVAFYVSEGGNFGDAALPVAVRESIGAVAGPTDWLPIHAHQLLDNERLELINRQRGVIVGGGGLFLPDTSPNGNSGWQWNVPSELLRRIEVPLSVFAVGYNLFPGQGFTGELFQRNLVELAEQATLLGLRNHGSIDAISGRLPARLQEKLRFVPCPTTILQHIHPGLAPATPGTGVVLLNAAFDRAERRFGDSYPLFLDQMATMIKSIRSAGAEVRFAAHLPADERLVGDLAAEHDIRLRVEPLFAMSLDQGYACYRAASAVIGMRGHATMIPFGLGTPVLSIVSHPKMRYFCEDISRPEWAVDVADPDLGPTLAERVRDILDREDRYRADIAELQQGLKKHIDEAAREALEH